MVKHLLMSKSGSPDSDTIASRPGLEPLKNGKNLTGGFMTLNTFLKAFEGGLDGYAPRAVNQGGAGDLSRCRTRGGPRRPGCGGSRLHRP